MESQERIFKNIKTNILDIKVFNASENSFGVASVIISGKEDAILIDAQFTLADAEYVAEEIKKSGKKLTAIYVSHGDPDFYFGLETFKKYFPEVTAYAVPATVEHIKATAQKKLEIWGERLGNQITSNAVLPQVLKDNTIELEGHKLEIIGLESYPGRTFVWIPAEKAVVGGINVFGGTFNLWMADAQTPESRSAWVSILHEIKKLEPQIVVPAHGSSDSSFDSTAVDHTIDYIEFYEEALKENKTSEDLLKTIKAKYPALAFETALVIGAKVNTGEMKW